MKPIEFKEQNFTLTKPDDMTDEECTPLPVHRTGSRIISCWKMSLIDRIRAVLHGRIWIDIHAHITHPPISLQCEKTAFVELSKRERRKGVVISWNKKLEKLLEKESRR